MKDEVFKIAPTQAQGELVITPLDYDHVANPIPESIETKRLLAKLAAHAPSSTPEAKLTHDDIVEIQDMRNEFEGLGTRAYANLWRTCLEMCSVSTPELKAIYEQRLDDEVN